MIGNLRYLLSRVLKKCRLSSISNSAIDSTSKVESGSQVVNTTMKRHSFCGYDCYLLNVEVGAFCSIADRVYVGGSSHPMHFVSTSPVFLSHRDSVKTKLARHDFAKLDRTVIGSDVWIGYGALVRAGVTIGHGAVIGMGAVVTKDVAPYSVVGGCPARHLKWRFDEDLVGELLESRWWELPDSELKKLGEYVTDPRRFLKELKVKD